MKPPAHIEVAKRLLTNAQAADYAGYDPFDGLNSRLFQATPAKRWPLARLAWLQFFKRFPINLRPLVAVPRLRNPKGVALFVLGLLEQWRATGEDSLRDEARRLGDWLVGARVDPNVWGESAWGYHFDWQARAFEVPHGTPNAITTCYVATALRRLGEAVGGGYEDVADDAGRLLDQKLFMERDGLSYFGYVPGEAAFVHNANLWVAALVAEAAIRLQDASLRQHALAAARQSVSMQASDGSWRYGTRHHHQFIDGFHTGYNLEALDRLRRALGTTEFDESVDRGLAYYRSQFIEEDGFVRYYAHSRWPEETHSFAQAVLTLLYVGGQEDLDLVDRVVARALSSLYLPSAGYFAYRRNRWHVNRIDYLRWSQAWAYYALSAYQRSLRPRGSE